MMIGAIAILWLVSGMSEAKNLPDLPANASTPSINTKDFRELRNGSSRALAPGGSNGGSGGLQNRDGIFGGVLSQITGLGQSLLSNFSNLFSGLLGNLPLPIGGGGGGSLTDSIPIIGGGGSSGGGLMDNIPIIGGGGSSGGGLLGGGGNNGGLLGGGSGSNGGGGMLGGLLGGGSSGGSSGLSGGNNGGNNGGGMLSG